LAYQPLVSGIFLSKQVNHHQLAMQQYFYLRINQPQPPTTSQMNMPLIVRSVHRDEFVAISKVADTYIK
jgi:hypothetical protein